MGISNVLELLGGVALFLFGMALMGDSLKKVAGNKLELILFRLSSTPLKGILLGTGVTAVIQSSSATSVMVVGFVNSGMMKVRQAIGVVMGAIIGTSITGWIICLSDIGGGSSGWLELFVHRYAYGGHCRYRHCSAHVLLGSDEEACGRDHARLCGFDVRHEGDEQLGLRSAFERNIYKHAHHLLEPDPRYCPRHCFHQRHSERLGRGRHSSGACNNGCHTLLISRCPSSWALRSVPPFLFCSRLSARVPTESAPRFPT